MIHHIRKHWGFQLLIAIGVALTINAIYENCKAKKPAAIAWSDLKTYYMKYGGMPCGEYAISACGVTLRKCLDGRVYYCLHDVATEEKLDK